MVEKITSVIHTRPALHSLDLFWTNLNWAQQFSQVAFDISIKTKFNIFEWWKHKKITPLQSVQVSQVSSVNQFLQVNTLL